MRRVSRFVLAFIGIVAVGSLAVGGCLLLLVPAANGLGRATDAQAREIPPLAPPFERSIIYDRNGREITQLYSNEDRYSVHLSDVPPSVISAVLATEDRDFFTHHGVDFKGLIRAFVNDVHSGDAEQGASTITQQLVKNTPSFWPKGSNRTRTAKVKARELVLASRLEQSYTKEQILERYLNIVYFGHSAYGVKAGAERYFNKRVQDLNVSEAALLAGMIRNPVDGNPIEYPERARDRRSEVLQFMAQTGAISPVQVARYARAPIPKKLYSAAVVGPESYFVDAMYHFLTTEENDVSRSLGDVAQRANVVYHGGLRITTTWDPKMQADAERVIAEHHIVQPKLGPGKGQVQAAMVAIDSRTGAVRALVGGPGYAQQRLNFATRANGGSSPGIQPGSGFKVFTLAAALEAGYSPDDSIDASRGCTFFPPIGTDPKGYSPGSDNVYGWRTLRSAIAESINCAFVRLEVSLGHGAVGPKRAIEMARRLGVSSHSLVGCEQTSVTLGVCGVTPLEMATAYATIANDGVRHDPVYVTRIATTDGTVLYDAPALKAHPVLSSQVARTVTQMLEEVLKSGTASGSRNAIGRPAAGKTGTTDASEALWFTGYTPQLTTSVAIGNPYCKNVENPACSLEPIFGGKGQAFGGRIAAPVWADFMKAALAGEPVIDFIEPDPNRWNYRTTITEDGRRDSSYRPTPAPSTSTGGGTTTSTPPLTSPNPGTILP